MLRIFCRVKGRMALRQECCLNDKIVDLLAVPIEYGKQGDYLFVLT